MGVLIGIWMLLVLAGLVVLLITKIIVDAIVNIATRKYR